ncbi:MAG: ATP synthase F1 subunit epsilon [Fibrobacterales bacterium]
MLTLKILTPSAIAFEGEIDSVVVPATDGLLGILKDHAPILASLTTGSVSYKINSKMSTIAIENGFLEVKDNLVSILTDNATLD